MGVPDLDAPLKLPDALLQGCDNARQRTSHPTCLGVVGALRVCSKPVSHETRLMVARAACSRRFLASGAC